LRKKGAIVVHSIEIKIRGYHLDLFGHVNNARYLEFLEEARWAMFEDQADLHLQAQKGYAFTVVNINIAYRRAAYMNDILVVESAITQINRRSAVIHQCVKRKGGDAALVAEADVTFVFLDTRQQKSALLEGELLTSLQSV
jgi:thioesterase-3